ncbi:glutamyl-tRNA(Gln) amidotransferase subunit B, mitochondrial [Megalops cyprinoides]|uniref:glutamyl-tRNA(Gln) amidotransferase subunit B, mitochondrial n=1 Tax=Megalops cyprinoides TaxID=118141 RepID=UPI00186533BF|nr:glutamyl-tRNA(Gln) amidotransferase subunit B, mitochondrial [Megalops cyprinoides]
MAEQRKEIEDVRSNGTVKFNCTNGVPETSHPGTGEQGIRPVQNGLKAPQRFTFSAEPTMEDIRRLQAEFTDERDWNQFHQPRNLLLALVGEVGEVSELFQWRGEVAEGLPGWTEREREQLAHELSDVLIYLLELAEKCHVDLPQEVLRKMALNRLKYPASKVHGSAKKYTEYQD